MDLSRVIVFIRLSRVCDKISEIKEGDIFMKMIVGLGNPGKDYEDTRHNIGFMVVDKLAREIGRDSLLWREDIKRNAYVAKIGELILVKPVTFMNNSGEAVKKLIDFYKINPSDLMVIHDDIDLPLGKIRIRELGGTAGHNGLESIIAHIKTDKFVRFRLGIGRGKEDIKRGTDQNLGHRDVIAFVLSRFNQSEAGALRKLIKYGVEAVRITLTDGLDKAMNRFN
jgi:peptidyl-tRNA hydrolase, PTH1 family